MISLPRKLATCSLREFSDNDAEDFAVIEYDADVKKYVGFGLPKRARESFIQNFAANLDRLQYAIESIDKRLIGRASLDRSLTPGEPTITVVLARSVHGKGIGSDVSRCIIEDFFSKPRNIAVRAEVHNHNNRAILALVSLGFKDTGETVQPDNLVYRLDKAAFMRN